MALSIGELRATVTAHTGNFDKKMDKSKARMKGFEQSAQKAGQKVMQAFGKIGLAVSAVGIIYGIGRIINSLDRLAKQANKLGLTIGQLEGLRFAAERAGVPLNTLEMAIQRIGRRTAEAAKGQGEAIAALKELGLHAGRLSRLPLNEQLLAIAKAMKRVTSSGDQLRLMMKLADSEGVDLLKMTKDGGVLMETLARRTDKTADAMGRLAKEAEKAKDRWADFKQGLKEFGLEVLAFERDPATWLGLRSKGTQPRKPGPEQLERERKVRVQGAFTSSGVARAALKREAMERKQREFDTAFLKQLLKPTDHQPWLKQMAARFVKATTPRERSPLTPIGTVLAQQMAALVRYTGPPTQQPGQFQLPAAHQMFSAGAASAIANAQRQGPQAKVLEEEKKQTTVQKEIGDMIRRAMETFKPIKAVMIP